MSSVAASVEKDLEWPQILLSGSLHVHSGLMSPDKRSLPVPLAWTVSTAVVAGGKMGVFKGVHLSSLTYVNPLPMGA